MHIFFSGIGGTAIGPLAMIAKQAGYEVSGSDEKNSQYIENLRAHGITDIHIGQTTEQIAGVHERQPIDWIIHTSAIPAGSPELDFCRQNGIKISKRDELLNKIITEKGLKLIAIAGTHGKTTTTAMAVWLFRQLGRPVSYSLGAKISFGDMGIFDPGSEYFVYECDEFDRNFLAFHPYMSLISGLAWDHHEIFPTQEDYNEAFKQFLNQSQWKVLWRKDVDQLALSPDDSYTILDEQDTHTADIKLTGEYNRRDAWLVAQGVHELTKEPLDKLLDLLSSFPGVSRRFEKIVDNLYTDYAHTPEKIIGAMSVAKETAAPTSQKIVVVYEPLTNRRMHHTRDQHNNIFKDASAIYWVPSYLARENPDQPVLEPAELIKSLDPELQQLAKPMNLDEDLKQAIEKHLSNGDLVLCLSGGGGGSLDEWLRKEFQE